MRNLKKFLALVLAMMMTLSLMVTANAASSENVSFGDSESITEAFVEDVTVLAGMKVFEGYGDGTFKPTDTVTRAEMAAILYRLVTGDVEGTSDALHGQYGSFKDVADDKWYAGYVGYCANAGLILGYGDGTFRPSNKVTGYEALVMLLRAIGYDQPTEFSKSDWRTHAASIATQRGLLTKVNSTRYKGTLSQPALREVVAEVSFQAARVTRVVYTPAFGYQTADHGDYDWYDSYTSLGRLNFGLTSSTGIIVGNQETGEKSTILGRSGSREYTSVDGTSAGPKATAGWTAYNYPDTSVVAAANVWDASTGAAEGAATADSSITVDNSLWLKWNTGIEEFAHEATFWYDGDVDGRAQGSNNYPRTVYAMFDRVEKEQIVWANDDELDGAGVVGTATQSLGNVADDAGFVVGSTALFNTAFDRMYASKNLTGASNAAQIKTDRKIGSDGTDSPVKLYKLISNDTTVDGDPILNVVIELNVQSSKVTGVDNVSSFKYVTAETSGTDFLTATNIKTTTGYIAQAALVGDSTKTLGANEIGWHITGTAPQPTVADGGRRNVGSAAGTEGAIINTLTGAGAAGTASKAYFLLGAVATKEGTVSSYHNHTANVPGTGWVVLNDGTKLNQSVLYNTVQANTIPQQGTIGTANDQNYGSMTYRFYLDAEGNYIGAEPIVGTEYVYGTYMDFQSQLGTSLYTYRMVGVNLDGEMVTKDVTKYNSSTFNAAMNPIDDLSALDMPYRGDVSGSAGDAVGVQPGEYKGWAVSGTAMSDDIDNPANLPVPVYDGDTTSFGADIVINSTDVALGAKLATTDADGAGSAATDPLYFTEKTKFIIVSGTGTDTQKVAVYNGISELLGGNRQVTINMDGRPSAGISPYLDNTKTFGEMVDFTMSNYIYAQDATGTAKQADVIFIPAEAVSGVGSSLYYVGNATPLLVNAYGEDATKIAMYNDGERGEYWIVGLQGAATANYAGHDAFTVTGSGTLANGHDAFYNLTDTGLKATDGEPIYYVDAVTASYDTTSPAGSAALNRATNGIVDERVYIATTKDAQTATICRTFTSLTTNTPALYKVTGAKVVNLNAENTGAAKVWPNVTDLTTLNEASSLNNINTYVPVVVSCVLSSDGLSVETIYVCYDQTYVD